MAQQVVIAGAMFNDVPAISVPDSNNVYHSFLDTTISTNAAAASDITSGKKAYVNGSLITGTNSGGGGSSDIFGDLLLTKSLGTISSAYTSELDLSISVSNILVEDYDLLLVIISRDTRPTSGLYGTLSIITCTGSTYLTSKTNAYIAGDKTNFQFNSHSPSSRRSTNAYGIYPKSVTISGSEVSFSLYCKYSSTYTGTISGDFTLRVYGISIYDFL